MISVIVPAHNEASVIGRFLRAMLSADKPDGLEIIVVCNGCTDGTAAIAGQFGPAVRVIETDVAKKTHALNLGDHAASGFPRIYADADVILSGAVVRSLCDRLKRGDVLAVAPSPLVDITGCSWSVRAYYEIRALLPSAKEGIGGSGVYAVSEEGRNRFAEFPDVIADDGYVRIHFKEEERETLQGAHSIVFAPRTIGDLRRVRIRAYSGTLELARRFPKLWSNRGQGNHGTALYLLCSPLLWPKLLVYYYVNIAARWLTFGRLWTKAERWQRDDTSRNVSAET